MTATRARCHDHAPRVLACSLAAVLLVGSPWTEEMTGMAEASTKAVRLDVTETRHDDKSMTLEYRVTNGGSEPIYLLDRPSRDVHGGGMVVMEHFAHVMFAEPDTVRVVRGILPLPLDHNVARRAPTFLTKVEPGQTITRSLELPLPLREQRSYYADDEEPPDAKKKVSRIRFELAYTEPRPGMQIRERKLESGPEMVLDGHWEPPYQRVLVATIPITPMELQLHSEPFDRATLVQ